MTSGVAYQDRGETEGLDSCVSCREWPPPTTATRNGGVGLFTNQTYDYDGLGRTIRERRLMPDGSYAKRFMKFDPAGHDYFKSEWVADAAAETFTTDVSTSCAFSSGLLSTYRPSLAPGTYRLCFDPFGRPQQVVGSKHSSLITVDRGDGSVPYSDTREAVATWCVNGTRSGSTCTGGINPDPVTTTRKDAFGRITSVTEPSGDVTSYGYDFNGKLTSVSQSPQLRTFLYDGAGNLRLENTPEKGIVTYDDDSVRGILAYGSLGNVLRETDPDGLLRVPCYDFAGRVKSVRTNEDGAEPNCAGSGRFYLQNTYDVGVGSTGGKLTQRLGYNPGAPGQPTVNESFAYSGLGGRLSQKDVTVSGTPLFLGPVTQSWSYNSLGLPSAYTLPKRGGDPDVTASWSYFNGLPVGLSVPGQTLVSNATYHPYGGLSAWTAGNNVTTNIYQDIGDLLPRPVRILAGSFDTGFYAYDGVGNVKTMGSDSFSYDSLSRLTSSTVSLQGLGYGYDRFGNLNPSLVNPGNNRLSAGTYDARGNLTEYAGQRYDYDGLSRQVAYNGGFERYLYDGAGERIARLTSPNPGADFYTVTPCRLLDTRTSPPSLSSTVSRVVQITGGCGVPAEASGVSGNLTVTNVTLQGYLTLAPTGTSPPPGSLPYRPNITRANNFGLGLSGLGRLTLSSNMNADGIVDVSGYYAYPAPTWTLTFRDEGNRLSTEYSVTSSTITRTKNYFHFGNLLVSTRDSGGTHLYYASDHLATPRLVTNQGGAAVENHTYQPFGQEITPLFGNQPLKFAAMERDQSSGNDSAHARVCSPAQGRFLSPDKLQGYPEDPQTWNRYAYARNNPLLRVDPDGLKDTIFQRAAAQVQAVADTAAVAAQAIPGAAGSGADQVVGLIDLTARTLNLGTATGEAIGSGGDAFTVTQAISADVRTASVVSKN